MNLANCVDLSTGHCRPDLGVPGALAGLNKCYVSDSKSRLGLTWIAFAAAMATHRSAYTAVRVSRILEDTGLSYSVIGSLLRRSMDRGEVVRIGAWNHFRYWLRP